MIVAIDGPAASGKGTLARRLARHFDFAHLDTGQIYRAVGLKVLRAGGDPGDPADAVPAAEALRPEDLDDKDLRGEKAGGAASRVAALPGVRKALLEFQRRFARSPPGGKKGAVIDGRDIASVVCPEAEAKLFVTASLEVRAERRHKELLDLGTKAIYAAVLRDLAERDARDKARSISPLVQAPDALLLDTTSLDADAAFAAALSFVEARRQARKG